MLIEDIARLTETFLVEGRGSSDSLTWEEDEIDLLGDGSLWARAIYDVQYDWDENVGDQVTPGLIDHNVTDASVIEVGLMTDDGREIPLPKDEKRLNMISDRVIHWFWRRVANGDALEGRIQDSVRAARDLPRDEALPPDQSRWSSSDMPGPI